MKFDTFSKARAGLIINSPFFASLVMRLQPIPDSSIDGIEVNNVSIRYNPQQFEDLRVEDRRAVLSAAALHLGLNHDGRRDWRDRGKWSIASASVVSTLLTDAGITMPGAEGNLADKSILGKSTEQVYSEMGDGNDSKPQPMVKIRDSEDKGMSAGDKKTALAQSYQAAKAAGQHIPDSLSRLIEKIIKSPRDWRSLLWEYARAIEKTDYSLTPPNRRFIHQRLYFPSQRADAIGDLVVVVDTSGSIDDDLLKKFFSEISAISDGINPSSVQVLYCDTAVRKHDIFYRGDEITPSPEGGGGTKFDPAFDYVKSKAISPELLLYFTDMCGHLSYTEFDYPVVWCATCDPETTAQYRNTKHFPGNVIELGY